MEYPAYLSIAQLRAELGREGSPYQDDSEVLSKVQDLVEHLQQHDLLPQVVSKLRADDVMGTALFWIVNLNACGIPQAAVPLYKTPQDAHPIQWASPQQFLEEFSTELLVRRADLAGRLFFGNLQGPRFWGLHAEDSSKEFADAWHEGDVKRLAIINEDIHALEAASAGVPSEITHRREHLDRLNAEREKILAQFKTNGYTPPAEVIGVEDSTQPGAPGHPPLNADAQGRHEGTARGKRGKKQQRGEITQKEAARRCGVSTKTIQHWQAGKATPKGYPGLSSLTAFLAWSEGYKIQKRLVSNARAMNRATSMDPNIVEVIDAESDPWD